MNIRKFNNNDYSYIKKIYEQGIKSGIATFEKEIADYETWIKKHDLDTTLIYLKNDTPVGFITISKTSERDCFKGVGEISLYIDQEKQKMGIGSELMERFIPLSEKNGYWTLYSAIFPQNLGSIKLHERFGFRKIGYREKIGKLNGVWTDIILFEKRSKTVGV